MRVNNRAAAKALQGLLWGSVVSATAPVAMAQTTSGAAGPAASTTVSDPNPYYIGAGEALTHDSNVYRIPGGVGDNYSSTSLRAGFDQPISRQRVFGAAVVTLNRYQDQTTLNNTSYALSGGANFETIEHLSGGINASLGRSLSAPTVSSAASASAVRNVADTRSVDAVARWGGMSLWTLEGNAGWSRLNYAASESAAGDSRQGRAGLGLYYRPGGPLTLGVAARFFRTDAPNAVVDPLSGSGRSNTLDSRNLDAIVGYELSGLLSANGRISYSKQTSSDIAGQDFSGITGALALNWRPTEKTSLRLDAARDAGSNNALYNAVPVAVPGTTSPSTGGTGTSAPGTTGVTPATAFYENNQVTDSVGLSVINATTAKIGLAATARYSRARLAAGSLQNGGTPMSPNTSDASKLAGLSATYEITRYWNAACNVSHEWRNVSGAVNFSYAANTVTCSTQLTLR